MTNSIAQATYNITDQSLENMALDLKNLPDELSGFSPFRESVLDNKLMASHGFPGNTEDNYNAAGRMTGYLREFASPSAIPKREDGQNIVAATVIHLFENEDSAASWMTNVFVKQFKDNVGREVGEEQKLVAVEELEIEDFYDRAVGIRAVQDGVDGILSTTVIDFRIGRILGVSFVVTVGDHGRTELTTMLGLELERNIVRELLATG
jgi:hypothetical protein|tara:strand:+ start:903 stop:1526 length:624 start_codon:yes stop_codon:yes gene_type:complete